MSDRKLVEKQRLFLERMLRELPELAKRERARNKGLISYIDMFDDDRKLEQVERQFLEKMLHELPELAKRERARNKGLISYIDMFDRKYANASRPPAFAHFLLRVAIGSKLTEELLGWIEERYHLDLEKFGPRRANLLFWSQTLRSIGPLMWQKVRNWGIFAALVEYSRRKIGL
jgi:hypothetical protein